MLDEEHSVRLSDASKVEKTPVLRGRIRAKTRRLRVSDTISVLRPDTAALFKSKEVSFKDLHKQIEQINKRGADSDTKLDRALNSMLEYPGPVMEFCKFSVNQNLTYKHNLMMKQPASDLSNGELWQFDHRKTSPTLIEPAPHPCPFDLQRLMLTSAESRL